MLPLPLGLCRVLDLTRSVAGATATRFLADLGAEVIIVEGASPAGLRVLEPALFDHLQRNKFACAIDVSKEEGRDLCLRLAAASDFAIADADAEALATAGLNYDAFAEVRSDVIYVSIDARVDRPGLGVGAAAAALTALVHRRYGGEGQRVEVSFERLAPSLQSVAVVAAGLGVAASPDLPPSGAYRCADGLLAVVARSAAQLEALGKVIGAKKPDGSGLQAWLATRTVAEAEQALLAAGVAAQRRLDIDEVIADPHLAARGLFEPVAQAPDRVRAMAGLPYRFHLTPAHVRLPAPAFGEHTAAVLGGVLGFSAAETASLTASGAVQGPSPEAQ
jgi:crotonobetainyl-CoA:carnitine CoA-transferase CaiB-like acyl-CoA transferase